MRNIKIKFTQLINFKKSSDLKKAERIKFLIEDVANDPSFREKIVNADFKDRGFVEENGNRIEMKNNQDILEKIVGGKEQFSDNEKDFIWGLRVVLYRSITGEVGHRSRDTIFTKKRKFRKLDERYIASHWIHEYVHVIGFTHDFKKTEVRPFSVPYLVGSIALEILKSKEYNFPN